MTRTREFRTALMLTVLGATLMAAPALDRLFGRLASAEVRHVKAGPCVISFIGHEVSGEMTRVILRANRPIDYRGGHVRDRQVILDLANTGISLAGPVVELGAPEVARVVIGPEIDREGEKVLKIRLTGVRARRHKVQIVGNELHIDLTPLNGSRGRQKGLPKVIQQDAAETVT